MRYVNTPLKLELPRQPQVADVGTYKELLTLYNALQLFHGQVAKYLGVSNASVVQIESDGIDVHSRLGDLNVGVITLTETVTVGDLVNVYSSSGAKGRLASKLAASRRPANAVALDGGVSGTAIRVSYGGVVQAGSFTPGALLYLSTAGTYSATKTTIVGEVSQLVGVAVTDSFAIMWLAQPFRVYAFNPQSTAIGGLLQDETGAVLYASGPIAGITKYYEPVLVPM